MCDKCLPIFPHGTKANEDISTNLPSQPCRHEKQSITKPQLSGGCGPNVVSSGFRGTNVESSITSEGGPWGVALRRCLSLNP